MDTDGHGWHEVARVEGRGRDWTEDLGAIARRVLKPAPVLVDPDAAADRVMATLDAEMKPLDRRARKLVVMAVYDRVASRAAAGM
jgi:hypothetical protein